LCVKPGKQTHATSPTYLANKSLGFIRFVEGKQLPAGNPESLLYHEEMMACSCNYHVFHVCSNQLPIVGLACEASTMNPTPNIHWQNLALKWPILIFRQIQTQTL